MKQPNPTSDPWQGTQSSTTAARSAAAPPLVPPPCITSAGSKSTNGRAVASELGTVAQSGHTGISSRLRRASVDASRSLDTSVFAGPPRQATTHFVPCGLNPGSMAHGALFSEKVVAYKRHKTHVRQLFDKMTEIVRQGAELWSRLADARRLVSDIEVRILLVAVDPATLDCRLVEGKMMQRGDRRGQLRWAHSFAVLEAREIRKQVEASHLRVQAVRSETKKAERKLRLAWEEMQEANRKWQASL